MGRSFADLHVGQTFESPAYTIPEDEALAFAREYDPQAFHIDAQAAAGSLFKGLAVSGWYTAARVFSLILRSGLDIEGGIIGQKVEELSWLAPVRPGDTIRVTSRIVDSAPNAKDPRRGTIVLESTAVNQVDQPVARVRARILAPPANR